MEANNTPPPAVEARPDKPILIPMLLVGAVLVLAISQLFSIHLHAPLDRDVWNQDASFELRPFHPPTSSASRGPCPFLNTIANHGYINHEGRMITRKGLQHALEQFNFGDNFVEVLLRVASLGAKVDKDGKEFLLDLNDLGSHLIEHDISLTREDFGVGNHNDVNIALVEQLLSYAESHGEVTTHSIAKARNKRLKQSRSVNKQSSYGPISQVVSDAECSAIGAVLGRGSQIDVETAKSILIHEQFPSDWKPPKETVDLVDIVKGVVRCGVYRWLPSNWVQ